MQSCNHNKRDEESDCNDLVEEEEEENVYYLTIQILNIFN